MNFNIQDSELQGLFFLGFAVFWVLVVIVHGALAIGVYFDADKRKLHFAGPGIWALATLLGGVFAAGVYWAIHHSALNPDREEPPDATASGPRSGSAG